MDHTLLPDMADFATWIVVALNHIPLLGNADVVAWVDGRLGELFQEALEVIWAIEETLEFAV